MYYQSIIDLASVTKAAEFRSELQRMEEDRQRGREKRERERSVEKMEKMKGFYLLKNKGFY